MPMSTNYAPDTGFGVTFCLATNTVTAAATSLSSVGGLRDFDASFDMGEADVSHAEDATTWSSFLPTRGSGTISGTVVLDPGSAEHEDTIIDAWGQIRTWAIRFADAVGTAATHWSGRGFFTSLTPSGGHEAEQTMGFTVRITGAPTFAGVA